MDNLTKISQSNKPEKSKRISIIWIILGTVIVTAALSYWAISTYIYAKDFKPVVLDQKEQQQLDQKLITLGYQPDNTPADANTKNIRNEFDATGRLKPQKYSEANGERDLSFSEDELNSILASNTDMAKKLAIDLSQDLISARLLIPLDRDLPIMGGKTLRVAAGVELAYKNSRPRVILKGVTIMGVPIPNAWLGGLKNIDLIQEFGDTQGFWKSFAEGVEDIHVEDGELKIKLKP